jgi:hypothetical protein
MNKFLSVLIAGLIAGSLSVSAFAADPAKPAGASTEKAATQKVEAKKDTGLKASVKKLFSSDSKKTDSKLK